METREGDQADARRVPRVGKDEYIRIASAYHESVGSDQGGG